jgi:hypothetical protein
MQKKNDESETSKEGKKEEDKHERFVNASSGKYKCA